MHTHGLTKHAALQSLVRAYTHMGWPKHGNISRCVPPAIIQSDPPEQSKQTMCCDEHLAEHLNVMTQSIYDLLRRRAGTDRRRRRRRRRILARRWMICEIPIELRTIADVESSTIIVESPALSYIESLRAAADIS